MFIGGNNHRQASSLQNLCRRLIFVSFKPEEKAYIEQNAHYGGGGCGQTDHSQAGIRLDAHNICHGKAHQQSLHQPLYHDPERFVVTVEVTHHAEQDGSGDGLGRKAHEVGVAVGNNSGICRMDVDAAGNTVAYMVPNYQIDGKTGTWLPYDSEVVEGVCFFMMRNEQRKDAVSPVVVDSKGVFVTDAPNGFENVRSILTEYGQQNSRKEDIMKAIRWLLKSVLVIMTLPLILTVWLIKWFVVFLHHCSAWIFYLLGSVLLATAILSYLMQQSQGMEALQMLIGGFAIFMIPQVVGSVVVLLELVAVMLRQVWYI